MPHFTGREHRIEVLTELARHANHCATQHPDPMLSVVGTLCPGLHPVRRAQLWHTVRSQVEVLDALAADRQNAVQTYLGSTTLTDAPKLAGIARADLDRALERLVDPRIDDSHALGCRCTACQIVRAAS